MGFFRQASLQCLSVTGLIIAFWTRIDKLPVHCHYWMFTWSIWWILIHKKNISIPKAILGKMMPFSPPVSYRQPPKQCTELNNNKPLSEWFIGRENKEREGLQPPLHQTAPAGRNTVFLSKARRCMAERWESAGHAGASLDNIHHPPAKGSERGPGVTTTYPYSTLRRLCKWVNIYWTLATLQALCSCILPTTLWGWTYHCPHSTDKHTEAQRTRLHISKVIC